MKNSSRIKLDLINLSLEENNDREMEFASKRRELNGFFQKKIESLISMTVYKKNKVQPTKVSVACNVGEE